MGILRSELHEATTGIMTIVTSDDMLIACKSKVEIWSTKSLLKKEFDMKELEEANKILGMETVRDRSRKILRVSQLRDVTGFVDSDYAKDPDKGRSITEVLEAKTVKVLKVGTGHNVADALTKVVPGLKLQHCLESAGMLCSVLLFEVLLVAARSGWSA
ncbi:hypothetical protein Tco_0206445 [Tanacetum coccineum]